jgi:hypothetical protein
MAREGVVTQSTMKNPIFVKLLAETPDDLSAAGVAAMVQAKIAGLASVERFEAKRYWKIPAWFEILFRLESAGDPRSTFETILAALGQGWERHRHTDMEWAIWSHNSDRTSFCPEMRWAHAEWVAETIDPE